MFKYLTDNFYGPRIVQVKSSEGKKFMKLLILNILILVSSVVNAVGIPSGDISGTYTITKNDIDLDIGVSVALVSINNTCHYYGVTQISGEGKTSIRIESSSCDGHIEKIIGVSVPLKVSMSRGDIVWIPVDGLVSRIQKTIDKKILNREKSNGG